MERRRAEAEHQAQLEAQESRERMQEEMFWGGVRPSECLRTLQANVIGLAQLDRAPVDTLAEADADLQRSVALWATRRAWEAAGLSSLDWAAPALAALERSEKLPAPFDDRMKVWGMLLGEDREVQNVHVRTTGPPRIELPTISTPSSQPCLRYSPQSKPTPSGLQSTLFMQRPSPSVMSIPAFSESRVKCSQRWREG